MLTPTEKLPTGLESCISRAYAPAIQRLVFCVPSRVGIICSWSYTHNSTPAPFPRALACLQPEGFLPVYAVTTSQLWPEKTSRFFCHTVDRNTPPMRSEPVPSEGASLPTLSFLEYAFLSPGNPLEFSFHLCINCSIIVQ